jgi:AbrB family looped-hinge helix DNA binding protein
MIPGMKTSTHTDTIRFTVKGQVVIPRWLRKEFEIEDGTCAMVYRDGDHIVLKPMTAKRYDALQGRLRGKGVLEALMEDRKRERDL